MMSNEENTVEIHSRFNVENAVSSNNLKELKDYIPYENNFTPLYIGHFVYILNVL